MIISIYDADGMILTVYEADDLDSPPEPPAGGGYIEEEADGDVWYVVGGVLTARPLLFADTQYEVAADGSDNVTVALPDDTAVIHEGATTIAAGSESFIFKTTILGDWDFDIRPPFPYLPQTIRITGLAV